MFDLPDGRPPSISEKVVFSRISPACFVVGISSFLIMSLSVIPNVFLFKLISISLYLNVLLCLQYIVLLRCVLSHVCLSLSIVTSCHRYVYFSTNFISDTFTCTFLLRNKFDIIFKTAKQWWIALVMWGLLIDICFSWFLFDLYYCGCVLVHIIDNICVPCQKHFWNPLILSPSICFSR